jgi:probable HAF family extracellular repeat protein
MKLGALGVVLTCVVGVAAAFSGCAGDDNKRRAQNDGGAGGEAADSPGAEPGAAASGADNEGGNGGVENAPEADAGQPAVEAGAGGTDVTAGAGNGGEVDSGVGGGAAAETGLYDVTPLGALSGRGATSWALNDAGDVVGRSPFDATTNHAFLWDSETGVMSDLGRLGALATNYSEAHGVNDDGLVVGVALDTANQFFTWQGMGTMTGIRPLAAGNAVNEAGQVAGMRLNAVYNAFRWDKVGGFLDLGILGTLGANDSYASGINEAGDVAGNGKIDSGQVHAFLWTESDGMVDIGTLATKATLSVAIGLNDAGQVVGYSGTQDDHTHAFLWTKAGGMLDLGYLAGNPQNVSHAEDINDAGQVVGYARTALAAHAMLWTAQAGMRDLNELLVPGATTEELTDAPAINDRGQIICNTAAGRTVLLTPH